jgi:Mg/Co/Ni transporter MgtE
MELGRCLRHIPTTTPDTPEQDVHEQFAYYNLMALPVLDEAGRLLGAVAVDDVVDRLLGVDWRLRQRRRTTPVQSMVMP